MRSDHEAPRHRQAEAVGRNYQEALQYPSLSIRGMAAASIGDKAANIVPSHAIGR